MIFRDYGLKFRDEGLGFRAQKFVLRVLATQKKLSGAQHI